ncbi:hypothetical protein J2Y83_002926 [Pseudomonas marginalis]|jgi:hypothetical protein|nr:hypothetical protein [Pseudomonas marginalis]MCP1524457.1 hypothetical protein [Pseudomonas marginalis]MDQ0499870.1 hypothetical protein [Pseudomonas marginalis]
MVRALMVALSKYIIALGNHVNAFNSADQQAQLQNEG